MPYDPELVAPMREELTRAGVKELLSAKDVESLMADAKGTTLIVVNSVCGCAAGSARPGVTLALKGNIRPDRVATVFAGQDAEATQKVRSYFSEMPPSSPSLALLKDGKIVHFVPRHAIEGKGPEQVAAGLAQAFEKYCGSVAKA